MEVTINIRNADGLARTLVELRSGINKMTPQISKAIADDIVSYTDAEYSARANEIATVEEAKDTTKWSTLETVPYRLEVEMRGPNARVVGSDGASWLEFGTGVKKNSNTNHPFLMMPYGSYGKGQGASGHSWVFAKGRKSYGYAATCGMYNATERVRQNISKYLGGLFK